MKERLQKNYKYKLIDNTIYIILLLYLKTLSKQEYDIRFNLLYILILVLNLYKFNKYTEQITYTRVDNNIQVMNIINQICSNMIYNSLLFSINNI